MRIRMRCALKRNAPALNFPPGRRRLSVRFRKPRRFAVCVWTSKGQPRREPLPHRHRRTYQTGYHRAGAFRAGCAGTRRSRAKRHGGILRRASGRLRLYPEWLGAKLWLPLCETAGSDWRYQPSGTDYRGVGEICPVADRQAGKGMLTGPVTILCWSFPAKT